VVYFCGVPETLGTGERVFAEMGISVSGDKLYRAVFDDWQHCDQTQRTRSRRKRDRYRVGKLEAIGPLSLETIDAGGDIAGPLTEMFDQRSIRFTEQGIADPFTDPKVRAFYAAAFRGGEGVAGRLHIFRVGDRPAAIRYNLVAGSRMFCLISSMSAEPDLRDNSPGKVGLTRILEQEFSGEIDLFDFGVGLNDEKRIWCNVQTPMRHHYLPRTLVGWMFVQMHRVRKGVKSRVKSNAQLLGLVRTIRARLRGGGPKSGGDALD